MEIRQRRKPWRILRVETGRYKEVTPRPPDPPQGAAPLARRGGEKNDLSKTDMPANKLGGDIQPPVRDSYQCKPMAGGARSQFTPNLRTTAIRWYFIPCGLITAVSSLQESPLKPCASGRYQPVPLAFKLHSSRSTTLVPILASPFKDSTAEAKCK
ncbi:hypothetical protein BASA60_009567 [Batrachochytrium salamandrivorans]|nr:hypothetical protein BASA60_009567 [Batrachochytrium salamandrivorans]